MTNATATKSAPATTRPTFDQQKASLLGIYAARKETEALFCLSHGNLSDDLYEGAGCSRAFGCEHVIRAWAGDCIEDELNTLRQRKPAMHKVAVRMRAATRREMRDEWSDERRVRGGE